MSQTTGVGCVRVSFSPPARRSYGERIRLAQLAVAARGGRWIIKDPAEIMRVTDLMSSPGQAKRSLALAYGYPPRK